MSADVSEVAQTLDEDDSIWFEIHLGNSMALPYGLWKPERWFYLAFI